MASNLYRTSKKLISALNARGYQLITTTREFMGKEGQPHKYYIINKAVWNDTKHKYDSIEIYAATSMVRIVLYLRDMWYIENNIELPTDQAQWNQIRKELIEKGNEAYGGYRSRTV